MGSRAGGGDGAVGSLLSDGLAEQYQDSKECLAFLTNSIFTELKGMATEAEKDRHRRLKQESPSRAKSGTAAATSGVRDELEHRGDGGFWVSPETGKPGSGTPKSPKSSPRGGASGGSGAKKRAKGGSSTTATQGAPLPPAVQLWSTKVAPMVGPVMTSLREAMSRGPAYDHDGPEDTAAAPLSNWPGRDADPKGWQARRKTYSRAEQAQV